METTRDIFDTILLLALPASGKSEVRKFLASFDGAACRAHFRMGETVQLDDYPYVHLMRRVDEALRASGSAGVFFEAPDAGFADPRDWGTLIELINEDFADLRSGGGPRPDGAAAEWLVARFDRARAAVGAQPLGARLSAASRRTVAAAIEAEAAALVRDKWAGIPAALAGRTVVIEFARGGAHGSAMPLAAPYGYAHSLSRLSDDILSRAVILYIWVTPEQSRAKNESRADPNDPGSILHHGVPLRVMLGDYGCDDMEHLLGAGGDGVSVRVTSAASGRSFRVPAARLDNRSDLTTFARGDVAAWDPSAATALRDALGAAFATLWRSGAENRG
jgi:hypothetical protein